MKFHLTESRADDLEEAARRYEKLGFLLLEGAEQALAEPFQAVLQELLESAGVDLERLLDPSWPADFFPPELRQRLARVPSESTLVHQLLAALGPLILRLAGPLVQVSNSFHAQFKGAGAQAVDHGGYTPGGGYMEVHGPYLLHQDFAGASLPTSPSALTLWVALNSCPDWNLRLYPGSHRRGLLCHEWLELDDPRLEQLGPPVDVAARRGTAVIFHALTLHGTSRPGPLRRVSCDLRFFPLTGFLPSQAHLLHPDPLGWIDAALENTQTPTLRAPLLEELAFLEAASPAADAPPLSVLNWPRYVRECLAGELDSAAGYLERMVNSAFGVDGPAPYLRKFHGRTIHYANLEAARQRAAEGRRGPP